jgi:HKD family nuclease
VEIKFIGQGFNIEADTSVAKSLMEGLADNRFNSFQCIVAFVSKKGVSRLTRHVQEAKNHIDKFRVIVGVDEKGTSKESLEVLLSWGVDCFVFSVRQQIIVHPKIYLFEGDEVEMAIIGSNNLTGRGLVSNIESSVQIEYSKAENDLLEQVRTYFSPILNENGESDVLYPLTQDLIDRLVAQGKVPTEAQQAGDRAGQSSGTGSSNEGLGNITVQRDPEGFDNPQLTPVVVSEEPNETADSEVEPDSVESLDATEEIQANKMWIETGAMTGGSRNILDLSKQGKLDGILKFGSVSFFTDNPEGYDVELNLDFEFRGDVYIGNTLKYTEDNSNWRLQLKGKTIDGDRLTTAVSQYNGFIRRILVFTKLNATSYKLELANLSEKAHYQSISLDRAKSGNTSTGREYGVFN